MGEGGEVPRTIRISRIASAIEGLEPSAARLVLIDGLGGAGKSVLAEALAGELRAPVVEGDDFYLPAVERQRSGIGSDEVGALYDWRRLERQVLAPLSRGEGAHYQRYDWDNDCLGEWVAVPVQGTVVVEGVYLMWDQLRHYGSVSIWVETPREVRLVRGIERDGEAARSRWLNEWMPAEDAYVSAMCPYAAATLVVDGQGRLGMDPHRRAVVVEARPPLDGLL